MKPIQLVQLIKAISAQLLFVLMTVLMTGCVAEGLSRKNAAEASTYNTQLGANHLQKGQLDLARDLLEKALDQNSSNALAHVVYGQLQHRIENEKKADTHFKRAIALEPDEANHRNNYGIFLCQTGEVAEAEKQFLTAANNKFYKTPQFALDNAGVCMLDADRLSDAEGYLRKALETDPKFANAYLHMAELLYRQQRLTVADAYFQRYMSNGRDTPESLYLGMQIKRDSGELAMAENFAGKLLNEFPESKEAGEYLARSAQ